MAPPDNKPLWRDMNDADRAKAYSPSSVLDGPLDPFIAAYVTQSNAAYAACPEVQTLSYGAQPAHTLDLVLPAGSAPAPLHLFIHGGYWQELSKREAFFLAPETRASGFAFAALDYTLAPHAPLDDIVAECAAGLRFIRENARDLNIDPERIVVSGSSAGAHLAAMATLQLAPAERPAGLILLSGIFELEPLLGTYINDAVRMDRVCALRNSPALHDLTYFPDCLLAWGAQETAEFKRQSRQMADLLDQAGQPVTTVELAGRNHFDIVFDLAPAAMLGEYVRTFAKGRKAGLL